MSVVGKWKKYERNGGKCSGIIKNVADGTHEARETLVLRDARITPRERPVALLQFANPVQRCLRRRLRTRPIRRRRWLAIFPRGRR